jgi:hypothetical protein
MRHSTGRRVGVTFGWVAASLTVGLALAAGLVTGFAIAMISEGRP